MQDKLKYYANLDGVRGIAALMIVVFHFFQGVPASSTLTAYLVKLSVIGQTGVTLFFVLSGFLITRILLATKEKENYFSNFYIRRSLRIFPLYYLFLIITYFIRPILFDHGFTPFSQQWYYYVYLQNFATTFNWDASGPGHFWSLAVEEHFYLFWPLIVFLLPVKGLQRVIAFIIIGAVILRVVMLSYGYVVFYFTFTRIDSLAIGAFLAILEFKGKLVRENARFALIAFVIILIPTAVLWISFNGSGNFFIQALRDPLESSIFFSLIAYLICIPKENLINRLLASRVSRYIGTISYGIYVYHPFAFSITKKWLASGSLLIAFIEGLVLSLILASLSYYLFEAWFLKFKDRFSTQ